ncbi:MAG: serine protein kinase RIO [Candidatus Bathyarchaeota archaeon]|nr:MAG: serine protein kinase RIO [Candidatus Bathyarchaeota archaeon]
MSFRRKVDKKLLRKEKLYETKRLMKEKRSEELEVLEEVLDRSTLMTIYGFLNKGIIDEIHGVVKAGKEARIYWGRDPDKAELAVKIYLTISSEFRKGMLPYIEGDPRFTHVRRDSRSLVYAWARKEFKNLHSAYAAGVRVPRPIAVSKNVLVMEFIGQNGVSAPILKEAVLSNPTRIYRQILVFVKKLYREAELVHADLSEYNIMMWRTKPVLFDVSQAVSTKHPMADQFLRRDLENLHRYFERLNTSEERLLAAGSVDAMYRRIVSG